MYPWFSVYKQLLVFGLLVTLSCNTSDVLIFVSLSLDRKICIRSFNMRFSRYIAKTKRSFCFVFIACLHASEKTFGFRTAMSVTNGDGEIRTLDPLLARQVLSQLSYTPTIIWHSPALPCRLQHSTIGRSGLNHRVRDGNGCVP